MSKTTIDAYRSAYRDGAAASAQPKWYGRLRRRAFEDFTSRGFPGPRDENWKYTDLRLLSRRFFQPGAERGEKFEAPELARWLLVLNNGVWRRRSSRLEELPDGVTVTGLAAAIANEDRWVAEALAEAADRDRLALASLNNAFARDGAALRVAQGVRLEEPVHIFSGVDAPGAMIAPRLLVVAEPSSHIDVVEHHVGGESAFTNSCTEIAIGDGATVRHTLIEESQPKRRQIASIDATVQRDGRFESRVFCLGGMLVRNDLRVRLLAAGAGADLRGLFTAWGRQHVDNHTRVDHLSADTTSDEDYRGVVGRDGRGVFNGKVVVHPDAQRVSARQANDNLLLDADAEVDTKPELEIYADDVSCSHGATVGRLDEDAFFYLRSRGLDPQAAGRTLTRAFVGEVLNRVDGAVHDHVEHVVMSTLPELKR